MSKFIPALSKIKSPDRVNLDIARPLSASRLWSALCLEMSGVWSVRAKALMIGFSDMVNMAGKPMTLKDLEAKIEQMAFQVDRARLEEWFKNPDKQIVVDDFIVDNLPHYIQELLKTSAESMRIGHDYLDIPSHKKRNVPPETFARLINKMPDCKEVYDRGPLNIGLIIEDDHRWVIILKTTKNHAEVFLTSLRRINDSKLNRWRTSGKRVY